MKKTRREFSLLSGWGLGALAGGSGGGAVGEDGSRTIRLRAEPEFACVEASLAKGRDSEILATFSRARAGSEAGEILLTRSNGGSGWTRSAAHTLFSDAGASHQFAAITQLRDGAHLVTTTKFRYLFEGKLRWRRGSETEGIFIRGSVDGGHHWSEGRKVDTSPFPIAWTRASMVEACDGDLLLPLAGQRGAGYRDIRQPIASFLMRSTDRGKTWNHHAVVAEDQNGARDYDEPALAALRNGRLVCLLRSHVSPRREPPGGYLYQTMSDDGGLTWSKPRKTSLWGHPAHLLALRDGRVLCTFGYRMHPDPGVRACVSSDGVQWSAQNIFTVKAMSELDSEHLQIGCPSSVELGDGRILTAYHTWMGDRQGIEGSLYRV